MKLNVKVDQELYKKIKHEAIMNCKTITSITIECIENYLDLDTYAESEPIEKTTNPALIIPDELHARLKLAALKNHCNMSDLVNQSFKNYLK